MNTSFNKFKNKILLEGMIKSLIIGLSSGALISSILVLLIKLKVIKFNIIFAILIGVAISLIIFVVLFFVFKPDNVTTAKRLDNQFDLKEKIHTMVEFENDDEYLKNIQRYDANNRLDNISIKSFKMKFHLSYLIVPIVALGLFITSVAVPAKAEEPPYVEPGESTNKAIFKQIEEIIKHVEANEKIDSNAKEAFVLELGNLITALDVKDISRNEEIRIVQATIDNVNNYIAVNNVTPTISDSLSGSNTDYIQALKTVLDNYNPDDEQIIEELEDIIDEIRDTLKVNSKAGRVEQLGNVRTDFFNRITAIQKETNIKTIISDLDALCETAIRESTYSQLLDEAFVTAKKQIMDFFATEYYNESEASFVEDSLRAIFLLPKREEDDSNDDNPGGGVEDPSHGDGNQNGESGSNGGGGGSGEQIGGSDIMFYDPELGYVKCTPEVLAKYFGKIEALLKDGVISEEVYNIYYTYYTKLSGTYNN